MRVTLDTNVLMRSVVHDDEPQARVAEHLLASASLVAVPISCLCECVWVARKIYRLNNADMAAVIRTLLDTETVEMDRPAVQAGLEHLDAGGDFADGVIAYQGSCLGGQVFASFDKKAIRRLAAQGYEVLPLS